MLLDDFKEQGFPISIHSPVICILKDGEPIIVYNRFDLRTIINKTTVTYLLGIWPGKKVTDGYTLDIEKYSKVSVPPEMYKHIDSAKKIAILIESKEFSKVIYKPGTYHEGCTNIESNDIKLYSYIRKVGLKHHTMYVDEK